MTHKEKQYQTLHYIRVQDSHGKTVNLNEAASFFSISYESTYSRFNTLIKNKLIQKNAPGDYQILPKGDKFLKYFESSQLSASKIKTKKGTPIKQKSPKVEIKGNKIVITIEIL